MHRQNETALPSLAGLGWRTAAIALGSALIIGGVGGLIGLGGGEFRLPILVGLLGFTARAAVPMNQLLSLVTLGAALAVRSRTGALVGVGEYAPVVIALGSGGISAAYLSAGLISKLSDQCLERAIAILLVSIGTLLVGERFFPAELPALVPTAPAWQIATGLSLGFCIGCVSTFMGVAGGELIIPTLLFVYGVNIQAAASAVLFISIPIVCMGLYRYGRLGLLPTRQTLLRVGLPMGAESFVGAAAEAPWPDRLPQAF